MNNQDSQLNASPSSLLIAGQFPPPVHGFSYITQQMAELLSSTYETTVVDLVPRHFASGVGYHIERLYLSVKGVFGVIGHRIKTGKSPVYIACEGGIGLIYTIILAVAARVCAKPVYLHHHSFNYVDQTRFLMRVLTMVLGRSVTHVFLCQAMAHKFYARYQNHSKTVVISNSAFVELSDISPKDRQENKPVTVGLISNLNEEKGLSLFLDTLRLAKEKGLEVRGVLAGPAMLDEDKDKIEKAKEALGDLLDYRGALYAQDKQAFYQELDIFLFPTCYINEAQPTVIAEAMSFGLPVLSYNRGCIVNQVGECGAVFAQEADFADSAVSWIGAHLGALSDFKGVVRKAFLEDRALAIKTAQNLLNTDMDCKECQ